MAYTANTAFSLVGLKTLNIPMYQTLKRMTPIVVLGTKVGGRVMCERIGNGMADKCGVLQDPQSPWPSCNS